MALSAKSQQLLTTTPPPTASAWTKSHQLEGDGLLPLLYHHLWKKNKSFQSCPGIKLPDTVVYEHNFPRAWYTYDFKNSEISKRAGRFLDTHHIFQAFSKTQGVDICAQYLFMSEGEGGPTTSVEFMSPKDLEYFLNHRKSRPDGILQKFLPTADCNAQIQVIWSPRVTLIQRRVNKNRLADRNIPAYKRAVTYDGPTYHSEEGLCSGRTKNQILEVCHSIVEHFNSTEHKVISRFVIYFKVSPVPKQAAADGHDTLWLLWASSLRIGDQNKYKPTGQSFRPLNLSPNISTEVAAGERAEAQPQEAAQLIRDKLSEADQRQLSLSCDVLFSKRIGVGKGMNYPRSGRPGSGRPKSAKLSGTQPSGGFESSVHLSATQSQGRLRKDKSDLRAQTPQPSGSNWPSTNAPSSPVNLGAQPAFTPAPPNRLTAGQSKSALPKDPASHRPPSMRVRQKQAAPGLESAENVAKNTSQTSANGQDSAAQQNIEWWTISPDIKQKYDTIHEDARQVTQYIDDIVYSLYSHLLRKNSSPFFIKVPAYIKAFFTDVGIDKLALLLSGVIRMTPYQPKQTNQGVSDDAVPPEYVNQPDVWYIVSDKVPPFGMQVSEVTEVIRKIVAIKLDETKKLVIERQRTLEANLDLPVAKDSKRDVEKKQTFRRTRTRRKDPKEKDSGQTAPAA